MLYAEIPDIFKSDDNLFHYTTNEVVLEHILDEKVINMSPRKKSIDPIESIQTSPSMHFADKGISGERHKLYMETRLKLIKEIETVKQVCFCMNNKKYLHKYKQPELEYCGFLKPRMWDQYGGKYKGACISFSLKKIKEKATYPNKPVEYINFNDLSLNNRLRLNGNELEKIGQEAYINKYMKNIESMFFRKHIDYIMEDEYRFISYLKDEEDFINIDNCINGIIVSTNDLTNFKRNAYLEYAKNLKIEILFLFWTAEGPIKQNIKYNNIVEENLSNCSLNKITKE